MIKYLLVLTGCILLIACADQGDDQVSPIVSLHTELGGDAAGYQRACAPREFIFPGDHLAHPEFRNEWWYVTGNVVDEASQRFGFHATIFRVATKPLESAISDSVWETSQFFMGHFAVSKEGEEHLIADERFARSAATLAGTTVDNGLATLWLEDWVLVQTSAGDKPDWQLTMSNGEGASINLSMSAEKPRVLQGTDGYSRKSADPCNASYYYAYTRLNTQGELMYNNQSHAVTGTAWLDREWSSSALAENQVGWDWFALQFADGRDVMFYQLRESDGSVSKFSSAVEVDKEGRKRAIELPRLTVDRWWRSDSGARYPVEGRLTRSDTGEVIHFKPLIDNQELNVTVRYWEGAITLYNDAGDEIGRGYLELTGY